ncbi:hypothetical protein WMW72_30910 [Paenibacillus filicis]|uniref:Uncharacterized protein n=1 Tax=Paenibacillus filicis TaxID=669464 RepID=A0ABU9DTW7_9BACL
MMTTDRQILDKGLGAVEASSPAALSGSMNLEEKTGWREVKESPEVHTRLLSECCTGLMKNDRGLLPLSVHSKVHVLSMEPEGYVPPDHEELAPEGLPSLGRALRELGADETEWLIPFGRAAELKAELVRANMYADHIVLSTCNACLEADQVELIEAFQAAGKDPIVVTMGNLNDPLAVPDVGAFVSVHDSRPLAVQSAARVLLGQCLTGGFSESEPFQADTGGDLR